MANIENYIAADYGGKLTKDDEAIIDGFHTTRNQNGVLYLVYIARAFSDSSFSSMIDYHANCVRIGKGRYLRRRGDPLRQSHDNVLAWAWWSVKYNKPYAREIYDFAKWRFFVYDPHKTYSLDPRCLLQGHRVFTLKLAAGVRPGWISTLWFAGNMIVKDHSSDAYMKSLPESDIVHARAGLLSKLKTRVTMWGLNLMEKRREGAARWYSEYFHEAPDHPAVLRMGGDL